MFKRSLKGFTLIEMVVVIIIIGILSAVSLPLFSKAVSAAHQGAFLQMQGELASQLKTLASEWQMQGNGQPALIVDNKNTFTMNSAGYPIGVNGSLFSQGLSGSQACLTMANILTNMLNTKFGAFVQQDVSSGVNTYLQSNKTDTAHPIFSYDYLVVANDLGCDFVYMKDIQTPIVLFYDPGNNMPLYYAVSSSISDIMNLDAMQNSARTSGTP